MTRQRTYTVKWQRLHGETPGLRETMECKGLDPRTALSRMMGAIRNSGPIVVLSVEPDPR